MFIHTLGMIYRQFILEWTFNWWWKIKLYTSFSSAYLVRYIIISVWNHSGNKNTFNDFKDISEDDHENTTFPMLADQFYYRQSCKIEGFTFWEKLVCVTWIEVRIDRFKFFFVLHTYMLSSTKYDKKKITLEFEFECIITSNRYSYFIGS